MKAHTTTQEHLADARERVQGILAAVDREESWDRMFPAVRAIAIAVAAAERALACERLAALEQHVHRRGSLNERERRDLITILRILKPWAQEPA